MFQNITENVRENLNEQEVNINRIKVFLKELLQLHNVIIFIITLCASMLSIQGEIAPFGIAMVAATLSSGTPVFGVFVAAAIGTSIGNGLSAFLNFLLSSIIYFALVLIFKPKVAVQERNELFKTGGRLFWACFIVTFFQNVKGIVLTYDIFMSLIYSAISYVFYKIFVNGLVIIREWKVKKAFTFEEVMATAIMFALASVIFNKINLFGIHLSNVVIVFLVMFLGWKSGMLVGATSGISMGLVTAMVESQNGLQILVFAVAGIFAGLLNRFGKIGVIIGFLLGDSIIVYLTNGNTINVIYFREIVISAIALLFVPGKVKIEIEDLVGRNKLIADLGENRLVQNEEMVNRLQNISQTISQMFSEETEEMSKGVEDFKDILFGNLESIADNIFCEDIINEDNKIADSIYIWLQENDLILEKDLIDIFKEHNNYIVIQNSAIREDLQEVIKIINRSYRMLQMEIVKMQADNQNRRAMKKDLENISTSIKKAIKRDEDASESDFDSKDRELTAVLKSKYQNVISCKIEQLKNGKFIVHILFADSKLKDKQHIANIASILSKNLGTKIVFIHDEKDKVYLQIYASEDKYSLQIGSSKITKDGSSVSGDCNLQMRLDDGKYLLAISDGMGSGKSARIGSKLVIDTLEKCLKSGFDDDEIIGFINEKMNINTEPEMYATVDFAILDMFTGQVKFAKSGACNSYIKNKKNVKIIESETIPVGIIDISDIKVETVKVEDGEIIIMCSDGLLEVKDDIKNDWIENYIKNINTTNVQKIADLIIADCIDNSFGVAQDDITVIVAKVVKKK